MSYFPLMITLGALVIQTTLSQVDKIQPWQDNGRCGELFKLFNGAPAQCNPEGNGPKEGPCCSSKGFCGNTTRHCTCSKCIDYSKKPVTHPGPWRKDGRCGKQFKMSHGAPYQCDPKGQGPRKGPCCSAAGYCGNSPKHCECDDCVNYGKIEEPWRADGKCGHNFPMFNGEPSQCNPSGDGPRQGPCCSNSGFCGNTDKHCKCEECLDYRKAELEEEATEETTEEATDEATDDATEEATDDAKEVKEDLAAQCEEEKGEGITQTNKYCALDCKHTMCKYKGPSDSCSSKTISKTVDEDGQATILETHNELRQKVASGMEEDQPSASNMRRMVWNEELALVAQRWAGQCTFDHDKVRSKLDGEAAGQNVYLGQSSARKDNNELMSGLGTGVQSWYDEVTDPGFNAESVSPFVFSFGTGHYSQVVWADTQEVGCGIVYYKEGDWFKELLVCNYSKAGNVGGGDMYLEGDGCSDCGSGYSCDAEFDHLCSNV